MKAWVARDKSEDMWLYFNEKPRKGFSCWYVDNQDYASEISSSLFPEVTWEDEEPTKVNIIIKQKK